MNQLLLFNLGNRRYSLEIEKVQEIVEHPVFHFIPCAPPFFCGAINFHGEILPALDLGLYLTGERCNSHSRVLALTAKTAGLALQVETARQIILVDPLKLRPASAEDEFDCIRSTFDQEGINTSVLDLDQLLLRLKEDLAASMQ